MIAASLLLSAAFAFTMPTPVSSATPAPAVQHLPTVTLRAPHAALSVQVARTREQRERGLMNVTALAPHAGMLFVFPAEGRLSFWMKDTLIDLDMVWLREDGTVSSVAAHVPHSERTTPDDRVATREGDGAYVLELPAGEAHDDGLVEGARASGLPPPSRE
ncbi:DUF192 domain-containing protein [bacterium]|nr:MAG: DUF192 domain-containing protein [bacterium]